MAPKYPHVNVTLIGANGNAFSIMGMVRRAMQKAGIDKTEIDNYLAEAMSGDYNNLLRVTMRWVDCGEKLDDYPDDDPDLVEDEDGSISEE